MLRHVPWLALVLVVLAVWPGGGLAAPSAEFSVTPSSPAPSEVVRFRAGDETCAEPAVCTWSGDDGVLGTGTEITHSYAAAGVYAVRLTVTGADGSDQQERTVTVVAAAPPPPPPPANHAPTVAYTYLTAGLQAGFSAATADADDDPVTVAWQFGDGGTSAAPSPSHTYAKAGSYTVTVTARDGRGGQGTASGTVTVQPAGALDPPPPSPAPPPPPVVAAAPAAPTVPAPLHRMVPFPVVRVAGRFVGRSTRLTIVSIRAPKAARVIIRCTGGGCPFARRSFRTVSDRRSIRVRALQGRVVGPGTVLDIRVAQPGWIGKRTRLRFVPQRAPRRFDGCVSPSGAPQGCPA